MTPDPKSRVQLINEPAYTFGSVDNSRHYDSEVDLTDGYRASSIHGVVVDNTPTMVIGDAGGASGVHENSLLVLEPRVFVAIGAHVVCFTLGNQRPDWILKVDEATCFGIYHDDKHDALISHGELSICRFSREGGIIWSASGADIFSEGVRLRPDCIEAVDFTGRVHHFDYRIGQTEAQQ